MSKLLKTLCLLSLWGLSPLSILADVSQGQSYADPDLPEEVISASNQKVSISQRRLKWHRVGGQDLYNQWFFGINNIDAANNYVKIIGPLGIKVRMHDYTWGSPEASGNGAPWIQRRIPHVLRTQAGEPYINAIEVIEVIPGGPSDGTLAAGDLIIRAEDEFLLSALQLPSGHRLHLAGQRGLEVHLGHLIDQAEQAGKINFKLLRPNYDAIPRPDLVEDSLTELYQRNFRWFGSGVRSSVELALPTGSRRLILEVDDDGDGITADGFHWRQCYLTNGTEQISLLDLPVLEHRVGYGPLSVDFETSSISAHANSKFEVKLPSEGDWTFSFVPDPRGNATVNARVKVSFIEDPKAASIPQELFDELVEVEIDVAPIGAFAPSMPFNCQKTANIIEQQVIWLTQQQNTDGSWENQTYGSEWASSTAWAGLALLSMGDPLYDDHIHRAKDYILQNPSNTVWTALASLPVIFLSEYWLRYEDDTVLTFIELELKRLVDRNVFHDMTAGHKEHPGYGGANINYGGAIISAALAVASKTPVNVDRDVLNKMLLRVQELAPDGHVPYVRVEGVQSFEPAFKHGATYGARNGGYLIASLLHGGPKLYTENALAMNAQGPKGGADIGHSTETMAIQWAFPALAASDPQAYQEHLQALKWLITIRRGYDGGFTRSSYRLDLGSAESLFDGPIRSASWLLALNAGKRNLAMTGKTDYLADELIESPPISNHDEMYRGRTLRDWAVAHAVAIEEGLDSSFCQDLGDAVDFIASLKGNPEMRDQLTDFLSENALSFATRMADEATQVELPAELRGHLVELLIGLNFRVDLVRSASGDEYNLRINQEIPLLGSGLEFNELQALSLLPTGTFTLGPVGNEVSLPLNFQNFTRWWSHQKTVTHLIGTEGLEGFPDTPLRIQFAIGDIEVDYTRTLVNPAKEAYGNGEKRRPAINDRRVWVTGALAKDLADWDISFNLFTGHFIGASMQGNQVLVRNEAPVPDRIAPTDQNVLAGTVCQFLYTSGWQGNSLSSAQPLGPEARIPEIKIIKNFATLEPLLIGDLDRTNPLTQGAPGNLFIQASTPVIIELEHPSTIEKFLFATSATSSQKRNLSLSLEAQLGDGSWRVIFIGNETSWIRRVIPVITTRLRLTVDRSINLNLLQLHGEASTTHRLFYDLDPVEGLQGGDGTWSPTAEANWAGESGQGLRNWNNINDFTSVATFAADSGEVLTESLINTAGLHITTNTTQNRGGRTNLSYLFTRSGELNFGPNRGQIRLEVDSARRSLQVGTALRGQHGLDISLDFPPPETGTDGWLYLVGDNSGLEGGIAIEQGLVGIMHPENLGNNTVQLKGQAGLFGPISRAADQLDDNPNSAVSPDNNSLILNNPVNIYGENNHLRVWGGRTMQLNGELAGAGTLRKTDTGRLVIAGPTSFNGALYIDHGAVELRTPPTDSLLSVHIGSNGSLELPNLGDYQISELWINGEQIPAGIYTSSDFPESFQGDGNLIVGDTTSANDDSRWVSLQDGRWSEPIRWEGNVLPAFSASTKLDFSTLELTDTVTASLDISATAAHLVFGNQNDASYSWLISPYQDGNSTLTLANTSPDELPIIEVINQSARFDVPLISTQLVTKIGEGTLEIGAESQLTEGLAIQQGSLVLRSDNALLNTPELTLGGIEEATAAIRLPNRRLLDRPIVLASTGNLRLDTNGAAAAGAVFSGGITGVNNLEISVVNNLSNSLLTISEQPINPSGNLLLNNQGSVEDADRSNLGVGTLRLEAPIGAAVEDVTISLDPLRTGLDSRVIFANSNNQFTGNLVVEEGAVLATEADETIPHGTDFGQLVVNGQLSLGAAIESVNSLAGTGQISGNSTLRLVSSPTSSQFDGILTDGINGALNFEMAAGEVFSLMQPNSYSGGTTLTSGLLIAGVESALGTGPLVFNNGGLRPNSNTTIANSVHANPDTSSELINGGSGDIIYTGDFSGTGELRVDSSTSRSVWLQGDGADFHGTLYFNGIPNGTNFRFGGTDTQANDNSNGANWQNTRLKLSGNATNRMVLWNGEPNAAVRIGELSGTGGRIDDGGYGGRRAIWEIGHLNTDSAFAGVIAGQSSLRKVGDGRLVLTGANNYSGNTEVTGGILAIDQAYLADSADVMLSNNGLIELNHGQTDQIARLIVDGIELPQGTYHASQHEFLLGNGALEVTAGPMEPSSSPYQQWLQNNDITLDSAQADPAASPDGSGVPNLVQFALGGSPFNPLDNGTHLLQPPLTEESSPLLTLAVRQGAAFSGDNQPSATIHGITYTIQGSNDLQAWDRPVEIVAQLDAHQHSPTPKAGYEIRHFKLSSSSPDNSQGYLRVTITNNQED